VALELNLLAIGLLLAAVKDAELTLETGALGLAGAREQGVKLRFSLDPEHDLVLVDRVQIQQVLALSF
jgi:two-component system, LuxR family, sensor kinase FixL